MELCGTVWYENLSHDFILRFHTVYCGIVWCNLLNQSFYTTLYYAMPKWKPSLEDRDHMVLYSSLVILHSSLVTEYYTVNSSYPCQTIHNSFNKKLVLHSTEFR